MVCSFSVVAGETRNQRDEQVEIGVEDSMNALCPPEDPDCAAIQALPTEIRDLEARPNAPTEAIVRPRQSAETGKLPSVSPPPAPRANPPVPLNRTAPQAQPNTATGRRNGSGDSFSNDGRSMTFSESIVSGSLTRPDDFIRGTATRSTPVECLDENIHAAYQMYNDGLGSEDMVIWAFARSLRCFNPCLSEQSALFLARCAGVSEILANPDPSSAPITLDTPSRCTPEILTRGVIAGEYVHSRPNPATGQCQVFTLGKQQTFTLFNGLDVIILVDNSESMIGVGQEAVRGILPELLRQTSNLRNGTQVTFLTQDLSTPKPVTYRTDDPNFSTAALETVDKFYRNFDEYPSDSNERDLESVTQNALSRVRSNSDLLIIVLTDEGDSSPRTSREYLARFRAQTTGTVTVFATNPAEGTLDTNWNTELLPDVTRLTGGSMVDLNIFSLRSNLLPKLAEIAGATGERRIVLRNPVREVQGVLVDGHALNPSDYRLEGGTTVAIAGRVLNSSAPQTVTIQYLDADPNTGSLTAVLEEDFGTRSRPASAIASLTAARTSLPPAAPAPTSQDSGIDLGASLRALSPTTFNAFIEQLTKIPAEKLKPTLNALSSTSIDKIKYSSPNQSPYRALFDLLLIPSRQMSAPRGAHGMSACQGHLRNAEYYRTLNALRAQTEQDAAFNQSPLLAAIEAIAADRIVPQILGCFP